MPKEIKLKAAIISGAEALTIDCVTVKSIVKCTDPDHDVIGTGLAAAKRVILTRSHCGIPIWRSPT